MLALARDEYPDAADAFREGERISDALRVPHFLAGVLRQWRLRALIRLADDDAAGAIEALAWIRLVVEGARDLLAAHPAHRTGHAAFVRALTDRLEGGEAPRALAEPLNERELTVLRFLPANLSAAEIEGELFLSVNTVKTQMRKLYAKLDVHTRAAAVERGRELGLLA
jgi:ATP/maltotriose-dependent transcriptional regulator MalT